VGQTSQIESFNLHWFHAFSPPGPHRDDVYRLLTRAAL
jgi:hypothetical protein